MRVEVVMAWPDHYQVQWLQLEEGATVEQALPRITLEGAAQAPACAVHGVLANAKTVLRDGDRLELLRPLLADPKDNRRRRARGGE